MSSLKPKVLFVTEDDTGLVQRLSFDSDDEEDACPGGLGLSKRALNINSSPIPRLCLFGGSDGDDNHLDSSTDSILSEMMTLQKSPKKRMNRCNFRNGEKENQSKSGSKSSGGDTPPYRRVRALRLFGSPQTPKTLLKQSELTTTEAQKRIVSRLFTPKIDGIDNGQHDTSFIKSRRTRPVSPQHIEANINPFTTAGMWLNSKSKRRRENSFYSMNGSRLNTSSDYLEEMEEDEEEVQRPKRLHLHETSISRYGTEFVEMEKIGCGEFGSVYRCINRLDGCEYALKKSKKPLKGTSDERTALNEVYAHAVLGKHPHVVRYYSAWAEDEHMLIQNEYCNGGSLADVIEQQKRIGGSIPEAELKRILLHVAEGLKYIHSVNLAHMDIKPGNIFISRNQRFFPDIRLQGSPDAGFEEEDLCEDELVYKIGDLGHVTALANPSVEEGDCRYLPKEILLENHHHLQKADIFALGLTIFEAGGGGPLPKNGADWHMIREGNLPYLTKCSVDMNRLIKQMIHPNPEERLSSAALTNHVSLVPYANKTKAQLTKELTEEKFKNELLSRELQVLKKLPFKDIPGENRCNRIIGGKVNRSSSVTNF